MTFLLDAKLYKTMGLSWFRLRCDGRPRPLRDGARAVRREGCAWSSMPESQLPRRRIRPPSKEYSSCVAPLCVRIRISVTTMRLAGWMRRGSDVLLVMNGGFAGVAGTATLWYGFGSLWTGAGNWSAFSCEDDGVGGGCGDFSESFGWGKGKTEYECGGGFECCFGFYFAFG